jgi:N-acetylglucosaminyl-diphospho-decaprenol L-rhamnosyltransferase
VDWTLITVTFNSAATLASCWSDQRPEGVRWLVVDNASTDNSAEVAKEFGARVIELTKNVGFSAANNVGLQQVSTRYVAFVNPDVVVDYASLGILQNLIDKHNALVGPQLINEDGSLQASARGLPFLVDKLAHRGVTLPGADQRQYLPRIEGSQYVAWTMGAALCGSAETFRALGGWDAGYFLYYEDHDMGLKAWRANVPVIATSAVHWRHAWARETKSFKLKPWMREFASARRFYARYPELTLPTRRWASARHRQYVSVAGLPVHED